MGKGSGKRIPRAGGLAAVSLAAAMAAAVWSGCGTSGDGEVSGTAESNGGPAAEEAVSTEDASGTAADEMDFTVNYDGIATARIEAGVSVHDPSIIASDGTYYIFGSHMAAASSTDLREWTQIGNGYSTHNQVFTDLANYDSGEFAYAGSKASVIPTDDGEFHVWAPHVIYNEAQGLYYMYYCTSSTWNASNLCYATSEDIAGPYEWKGTLLYSGFTTDTIDATNVTDYVDRETAINEYTGKAGYEYNYDDCPNAIDPTVFYDEDGRMWMVYGSWSGGIFLLEVDEATGELIRPGTEGAAEAAAATDAETAAEAAAATDAETGADADAAGTDDNLEDVGDTQADAETADADDAGADATAATDAEVDPYFGQHLIGGGHVSIEAPYILYDAEAGYYYLFVSYGDLTREGGYQIRVFRSETVDGEYVDMNGAYPSKGDAHQYYGLKLSGNYFLPSLESAYMATGHNSAMIDGDGKRYLAYHTRFDEGSENHEPRVKQYFINEEGWPCVLPYATAGETISQDGYEAGEIVGRYYFINQGTAIDSEIAEPIILYLTEDGKAIGGTPASDDSGETSTIEGTWTVTEGTPFVHINYEDCEYSGVFCAMQDEAGTDVMTFTAVGGNASIWGVKYAE